MANVIIVGVDGGAPSQRAARRAAELAATTGAHLHVLVAVDDTAVAEYRDRPGSEGVTSGEVAESVASDVAQDLKGVTPFVTSGILHGKPATALVEEAERLDASLIVIGNKRAQGIGRVLGSVASSVIGHAHCDVYVVKTV